MTLLAGIAELQMVGVFDRGVPNKERVVLRANTVIDIGEFAVIVGVRTPPPADMIIPVRDHLFWFGTALVGANDWLFLYTGHGVPDRFPSATGPEQIYTSYWGHSETIFHDPQLIPAVVRFRSLLYKGRPAPASQPAAGGLLSLASAVASTRS